MFLLDFFVISTFVIPIILLKSNQNNLNKYGKEKLYINIILIWIVTILDILIKFLPNLLNGDIRLNDTVGLLMVSVVLTPTIIMTLIISSILYTSNSKPNGKISY